MKWPALALVGLLGLPLGALDLPPAVGEALRLELQGRLNEALDQYSAALSTDESLASDTRVSLPATAYALSKGAALAIDLGRGDEAWDWASRLVGSDSPGAVEAGTALKLRLLRLAGRPNDAGSLAAAWTSAHPKASPGPALTDELVRLGQKRPIVGPPAWVASGVWSPWPSAGERWGLTITETVRLQVGAFADWGHALTLVDMLREQGWVPQTEAKVSKAGEKLFVVSVLTRQPEVDRGRLAAQGLSPAP